MTQAPLGPNYGIIYLGFELGPRFIFDLVTFTLVTLTFDLMTLTSDLSYTNAIKMLEVMVK